MVSADRAVFEWLNGLAGRWPALDSVMRLVVSDFFLPVVIALAVVMLWFAGRSQEERTRWQWTFIIANGGAGFANLAVSIFNSNFYRARPFIALEDVHVLFYRPHDPSFPSNAAAYGFAMATGVFLYNKKWGLVVGAFAFAFAFARVYAGMHFPLDVIGGALIGILVTWLFAKVLSLFEPFILRALALLRRVPMA
ncbi:MAG: phosphatase PAP2 family protein [Chloroflexi bacterium]|nr:phosphatase PAP2 family protein [Chloroflexota bacterium]